MKTSTILAPIAVGTQASGAIRHDLCRRRSVLRQVSRGNTSAVDVSMAANTAWREIGGYFITVDVGTPPQTIDVLLDTGSTVLWLPSSNASRCEAGDCPSGSFLASESSTYSERLNAPHFKMYYKDRSMVQGDYSRDVMRIGSSALRDMTFGFAHDVQMTKCVVDGVGIPGGTQFGIMGLSYAQPGRNPAERRLNFTSDTVPLGLKQQGYVGSQSYSVYIDDLAADRGHIVFGGIDTAKYQGELKTLDVVRGEEDYEEQIVNGVIDLGGKYLMPCSAGSEDIRITAQFPGVEIDVPLRNMLVPAHEAEITGSYGDVAPLLINGTEQCFFTPTPVPDNVDYYSFGDPVFRSACVFFNLDEYTISIAQPSYNVHESNLMPIGPGDGSGEYPAGTGGKKRRAQWWRS